MELFRYWRWQLRSERPTIEHVQHRPIEQNMISIVDGIALVRDGPPCAVGADGAARANSVQTHSSRD
jgi:hypothetical protein